MIEEHKSLRKILNGVDWDFGAVSNSALHSVHPYPAKFIPDIPRALIENLSIPSGTVILDPFCGSGVTLTEAQNAGIESIGVDLNPIACMLSRVKTTPLGEGLVTTAINIVKRIKDYEGEVKIPNIKNLDHWFKPGMQRVLSLLVSEVDLVESADIKDALRFCISSIIVKVSNQESDTRYAAIVNAHSPEDALAFFLQKVEKLAKIKADNNSGVPCEVINKNSLKLTSTDFPKPIGLVITSPPYPNAYEYWLYHKYRMWWLGHDPISVKDQEIGARAHYFKKNHQTEDDFIQQMEQLLKMLFDNCANGAHVVFIIGRSKIHGKIIENETIIKEAGEKNGFVLVDIIERNIKSSRKSFNLSHARIKKEYLVILKKTS